MHTVASVLATVVDRPGSGASPDRWEPPWLELLVAVAVVLVALAVVWWLFVVVRVHDRVGGKPRPRRHR